jgi:GntR family transcriptional regulator
MMEVDISSFIPIYEQIKKEIKRKISLGDLKPKEPLPSIRDLAEELLINPNTVARAYRELELEGFIYTRKGKGCYVTDNSTALVHKEREAILNQIIDNAIEEAKRFNLTFREIKKRFEQRIDLAMEDKKQEEKGE